MLAVVGLVAAGAVTLRDDGTNTLAATSPADTAAEVSPLAPDPDALSTVWYCAGGTALPGGPADVAVVVANLGSEPATGSVTVTTTTPGEPAPLEPSRLDLVVAPGARQTVRLGDVATAQYAAALVETRGGRVVVDQEVTGPTGRDLTRCTTRPSESWYFPYGQTTTDATLKIALFNPFPGDAVIDITFDTEEGYRNPVAFDGILVQAGRLVVVDIDPVVTRRERVSTRVEARSGRLVAQRVQTVPGADGTVAVDAGLGAPRSAAAWFFPDGRADQGTVERFVVFNPGEASTDVEIILLTGAGQPPARLRVPAGASVDYVVNRDPGVLLPVVHGTLVQTLGAPIVVERVLAGGVFAPLAVPASAAPAETPATVATPTTAPDPAAPPPTTAAPQPPPASPGFAASLGSPVVARQWIVASGAIAAPGATQLTVLNVSDGPVEASVRSPRTGAVVAAEAQLLPGRRFVVDLPAELQGDGLEILASGVVVVGRIQTSAAPLALGADLAVPAGLGAALAEPTAGFDEGAVETPSGTGIPTPSTTAAPTTTAPPVPATTAPAPPPTVPDTTAAPPPPETTAPAVTDTTAPG
jgi:hypothetical protein